MSRFLFNDASLHGQFASHAEFLSALAYVLRLREAIHKSGFRLEVNRLVAQRRAVGEHTFREAISRDTNPENKRRILSWLDKDGPFWDDPPIHSPTEYFDCEGEIVTDTALAEACGLAAFASVAAVVSLTPSRYFNNPLEVFWRDRLDGDQAWMIPNFQKEPVLAEHLRLIEKPPASWQQVLDWTKANCPSLLLSPDIISQLPTAFVLSAAQRAQVLFHALDNINSAIQKGEAARFEELRRLWMEGDKARMTDSSDGEKAEFAGKMNFKHPRTDRIISCTWHAKIKTPQFRIHFEWPKQDQTDALFIGYFGPKLTKR